MQKEFYWHQRSKKQWLEAGDQNTTFFHRATRLRRSRNNIHRIIDDEGKEWKTNEEIGDCILKYYRELFKSTKPAWSDIDYIVSFVEGRVDNHVNSFLNREFTEEEIRRAVFDLNPSKAPGPDGFAASFFHAMWETVSEDVVHRVKAILNSEMPLDEWNSTVITLIPKVKRPERMKDFRPISLCNVCYKIVARAITNRLREIMDKIIDEN